MNGIIKLIFRMVYDLSRYRWYSMGGTLWVGRMSLSESDKGESTGQRTNQQLSAGHLPGPQPMRYPLPYKATASILR